MAIHSVFRFLLRLIAISWTVFCYSDRGTGRWLASAEITVQPLRNATDRACQFMDRNGSENVVFVRGSSDIDCHLQVIADTNTQTLINILSDGNLLRAYHLYVERQGDVTACPYRYLAISGQTEECISLFFQEHLHLILQGNISIAIHAITNSEKPWLGCPEILTNSKTGPALNLTQDYCQNIEGYDEQITCELLNGTICRLEFWLDCNVTLGIKEVQSLCYSGLLECRRAMIIYPSGMLDLDLSYNNILNIEVVAFQGLTSLQVLSLEGNLLTTLHLDIFHDLNSLTTLHLHNNLLFQLDLGTFQGLDNLTNLKLDGNQLEVLQNGLFHGLVNLRGLYLYGNQLVTLEAGLFQGLKNIHTIELYDNKIATLPDGLFQGLDNLKVLFLYLNRLSNMNGSIFHGLRQIEHLSLSRNVLTVLPEELFWGLECMFNLYLYGNQLSVLDPGLFRDLYNLDTLELDQNILTELPVGLFLHQGTVIILWLNDNHIESLQRGVFKGLGSVDQLYLQSNRLVTLQVGAFHGLDLLRYLYLFDSSLTSLGVGTFEGLNTLTDLYLDQNKLHGIDPRVFKPLGSMRSIGLTENNLTSITNELFYGLDNLEYLFLEINYLEMLSPDTFTGLFKLRYLFLFENRLSWLGWDIFKDNANIAFLELSSNRLIECPNIKHLNKLEFINLRYNTLTTISHDTFSALQPSAELYVSQHEICSCYIPSGVNCSASDNRSPYLTCDRLLSDRALVILMWLIGINALCGNLFVLVWRHRNAHKNKVQDFLLSNLALSDSFMGIYMLIIAGADIYYGENFPLWSEKWRSGVSCRIAGSLSIISSEASVFFVTLISIDRLVCIKFPYTTRKLGKYSQLVVSGLLWFCSVALGVVPSILAGDNFKFYDNSHVCVGLPLALTETYTVNQHATRIEGDSFYYIKKTFSTEFDGLVIGLYFSTAIFLCLNCVCYLIILACYIEIVRLVIKSSKQSGRTREMKEQITLTTRVTAIVATDFMCWFPIILMGILVQTKVITLPPSVYAWSVTFILPLNSAINPYLYTVADIVAYRNKKKKESVKKTSVQVIPLSSK